MTEEYLQRILKARVYDVAIESPLEPAPRLSQRLGNRILFKREDLQPVFSFKLRGAYNKIVHLLGKRTTIGRTPDNDVPIDAEFISRHHAVALRAGGKTVIEDLNSTNGTYVNGQRISRRTLKDGDLVMLGKTEFRFSVSKAPA